MKSTAPSRLRSRRRGSFVKSFLHDVVAESAQRSPNSAAFTCNTQKLTYAELDRQSNQLGQLLTKEGLQPGDRVGVFMPRCIETAIAVYGVLKAGGVFVPVDPAMPAGGVRSLITNCGIRFLISHSKKQKTLEQLFERQSAVSCVIGVDQQFLSQNSLKTLPWEAIANAPDHAINPNSNQIRPQDPAYIMYSSGSTGSPKGITHSHESGLAYARLSVATYDVTPNDVIANHSPINFDMSTFGYFSSCYAGATTAIIPAAHTKAPASLAKLISQQQVTIWYSVPLALVQLLLNGSLDNYKMNHLRWVLYGGEPFSPRHLKRLMNQWSHARFSNVYGPAEVNQCTYYHIPPEYSQDEKNLPVPIGRTWDETHDLIIDQHDEVVEEGELGELLVCSSTMMLGYWGQPELNQRAFFHHSDQSGAPRTFYRTGDLVRRDDVGQLLFLGRKDRQVKVRGYRVELDDIERTLTNHPEVREASVYWISRDESREIQAAIILNVGSTANVDTLKAHLGSCLSSYAIPERFVLVDDLPRTGSGKTDRKTLQEIAQLTVTPSIGEVNLHD